MTAALEGDEWSAVSPGRTLPPGKTRYPFYRRLGGPQGRSGPAKNLVPTGIRSRTVQPVVSRYTNGATRPTREYGPNENRRFQDTNPHTTTLVRHVPPYEYTSNWRKFFLNKTQTDKSSEERLEFLHDDKIIIMLMSSYRTNIHTHSEIQTRILNVWLAQDCMGQLKTAECEPRYGLHESQ